MRWIWIDRFTNFESGKSATAIKCLSMAEDHFAEHFPGYPVMPAPLMIEGLAQTGGILVGEANDFKKNVVLAKIPHAKFTREAVPGEVLTYLTNLVDLSDQSAMIQGTVSVDNETIGEVEILFAHVDATKFGGADFVFDGELKYLLGLAKKAS
ncbi:3-hydroxyacyl-ACP dehydratase FabZ family protein [soil metagenome]